MVPPRFVCRVFIASLGVAAAFCADWRPIDPETLTISEPKIDPNASAEAVFWETWLEDRLDMTAQSVYMHYVRVKIFNQRGAEERSTIDLTTLPGTKIRDLKGRTVKPDGSIITLDDASVFERTLLKVGGWKVKARSFTMPGVEAGDIIEYQWREIRNDELANYARLYVQHEIPTWSVKFYIKPLQVIGGGMLARAFNCETPEFKPGPKGYHFTEFHDIPAFAEEPFMPPEGEVRSWVLLYYASQSQNPEDYWTNVGKWAFRSGKEDTKIDRAVKQAAAAIVGDVSAPEEQLERIRRFCLSEVRNIFDDRSGVSSEERSKLKPNRKPSDTLTRKVGTGMDILLLFAALSKAAGLDARIASVAGRDDSFFDPSFRDPYFLNRHNVAVRVDAEWRFYDPTAPYLPSGMLLWPEEGVQALVPDPDKPEFVRTPLSGSDKTVIRRKGAFRLDAERTLEGTVRVEMTGHAASQRKSTGDGETPEECQERIRQQIQERLALAAISEIRTEHGNDLDKPYIHSYRIRVPEYAARTGKRLFLRPSFFHAGREAMFTRSERVHDIYFPYAWSEQDEVVIELPEGYELENADAPHSVNIGNTGFYGTSLSSIAGRRLVYRRSFRIGDGGNLLFPVRIYPEVKRTFDFVHRQDNHTLTLRRAEDPPSS